MIITRDPEYRSKLLDEQRRRMGVGVRRSGLHVSDLVFCTRKAWAERTTQFTEEIDDNTVLTFTRGLSHEDLLAEPVNQVRTGYCFVCQHNYPMDPQIAETQCCPVCGDTLMVGTIDWVAIDGDNDYAPVEMKSTLKSARKDLAADMPWYLDQLKSYMFMHGRNYGRVCVLHIMGDYARESEDVRGAGPRAEMIVYKCEWQSDYEREAWGRVLGRRKVQVEGSNKPPIGDDSPAHQYICSYCVVGELLPDGTQCEKFPWVKQGDGRYIRKGSKTLERSSMESLIEELAAMKEQYDDSSSSDRITDARSVSPGVGTAGDADDARGLIL